MRRTFTMQLYDQPAQRSVATIIAELAAATGTDEREVAAAIQSMIQADNAAKNAANNMGLQREPGELDISFRSRVANLHEFGAPMRSSHRGPFLKRRKA